MMTWRVWLILFAMVVWSADANAKFFYGKFGAQEQIEHVGSVTLPGPAGERLYLARKVTMRWLFVPYSVHDDGFVLAVSGDAHKYYPMPVGPRLQELQDRGYLPNPLPAWRLSTFDRVTGNALWIFILGVASYFGLKRVFKTSDNPKRSTSRRVNTPQADSPSVHPAEAALKRAIAERKKEDPLAGAKVGGRDLVRWMMGALKDEKGVHVETLFCALGSIAGYACQAGVRAEYVQTKGAPESKAFVLVQAQDKKTYYFGDLLNKPLAEDPYSVWSIAGAAAQQLGVKELIDVGEIFTHVTTSVGGEQFGVPRVPANHRAKAPPATILKLLWPKVLPMLKQYCDKPSEWSVMVAYAIREAMHMSKEAIDPRLALTMVMESAVPMSKLDLAAV